MSGSVERRDMALIAAGALISIIGAICGIGGGLFAVPLLHYVFKLPLRRSVATSLALVFATGLAATGAELLHQGDALRWNIALALIAGALLGAQYGFVVSKRLNEVTLKGLFLVALAVVGVRMWLMPASSVHPTLTAGELDVLQLGAVLALGLLAGTIAPMLGIGGGLVAVPGLLLLLPDAGSLGARAASLAMAVPTAARSLHLYWREGSVERRVAGFFAGGALIGAVLGVQLVHIDGVARLGQILLGSILLLTATRFGVDISRRLRAARATGAVTRP